MNPGDTTLADRQAGAPGLSSDAYRQLVERAQVALFVVQDGRFKFINPLLAVFL